MLLGLLALPACATTSPHPLEIPLRSDLIAACEKLALPQESELPPLAEGEAGQAQLRDRRWWAQRDIAHEGLEQRLCRQRDELIGLITFSNQRAREVPRETF